MRFCLRQTYLAAASPWNRKGQIHWDGNRLRLGSFDQRLATVFEITLNTQ
jgi:hypothetical protein